MQVGGKESIIQSQSSAGHAWTFLSNHSHVLICLARNPESVLRDVANQVGITERAVQRIVADLQQAGYIVRHKDGRRNTYSLDLEKPLRHPVEQNCTVGQLVKMIQ
jgi:DNA-binding MarR family transcriptional regulator